MILSSKTLKWKTLKLLGCNAPCMAAHFWAPFNPFLTLELMAHNHLTSFPKTLLNTLWPSYRGKRAGRLVRERERERVSMKQIAVVSTRKVSGCPWFSAPLHCHNPANCIRITPASTDEKGRIHRRPMYHLYLSRMSCPWLPKWMNYAILSSMLI